METKRKEAFSSRLRKALTIRGMRQSELCQLTKIPKSAISQYLRGDFEPKQDRIYLIAKTLDVSEAWLIGYDVPIERENALSPSTIELSEGEKALLELFNRVPEDQQKLVLQMIRAALGSRE